MRSSSVLLSMCALAAWLPAFDAVSATELTPEGELTVFFDIRPEECPNRLITGYPFGPPTVPTAVLGTDGVDVTNIQATSLLLIVPGGGGFGEIAIPPIQTGEEDVAAPVADPSFCNCTADGPDVALDLTALFDQTAILNALELVSPDDMQPEFELCITGTLLDGTPFRGCDCVVVDAIPLGVQPSSWGRTKSGYR